MDAQVLLVGCGVSAGMGEGDEVVPALALGKPAALESEAAPQHRRVAGMQA